MYETTRRVRLVLSLEATLANLNAVRSLSMENNAPDNAWQTLDDYRIWIVGGLTPYENRILEMVRCTADNGG